MEGSDKGVCVHRKDVNRPLKVYIETICSPFLLRYSVFTDGAFIYFIIEPLIGPTLLDSIRQGATVSNEKAVRRIALQVMSSLEALHRNKIVYCDLCPENIYVCKDESVKLMSYPLIKYIFLSSVKEYLKKHYHFIHLCISSKF